MAEYDLHSNVDVRIALETQTINSNITTNGEAIDTLGFDSLEFVVQTGMVTNGEYAIKLEESTDISFPILLTTLLSSDETLGLLLTFVGANDNMIVRVGSIGKKRYQRLSIVSTNVVGMATVSAAAILAHPHTVPIADSSLGGD